jgi:hypothetical protein
MAIKIERGVSRGAARVVLYGTEGIGKSTLAAQFPNPVILDTEDGTRQIDCARVRCGDWMTLTGAMVDLGGNAQGFQTVVVDSVDWAERLGLEHMLRKDGKRSVEDYGFGKGFVKIAEVMSAFLGMADNLIDRGVNVVFVGHSTVKRTTPPDLDEGWDRYELKLSRQVAPLVKEWADALLFANYRTRLVEGADGRTRAKGGKERILFAERTAAWDAKNRYGLGAELPMSIEALAALFEGQRATASVPARPLGWMERVAKAQTVEALGRIADEADQAVTAGDMTESQRNRLDAEIAKREDAIDPQEATA